MSFQKVENLYEMECTSSRVTLDSLHKKWSLLSRISSVNVTLETTDLVTFAEEILNRKFCFLCSDYEMPLSKVMQVRVQNLWWIVALSKITLVHQYFILAFSLFLFAKVWCYFLLFTHHYLAGVVVYDTLLWLELNVNTFRTHIFIYCHFYLTFFCYVLTYLASSFPATLPMIVVFW